MNNQINNIKVDNTGVDPNIGNGTTKGTVSSILGSRAQTNEIFAAQGNSILGSQREIENQIKGIESILTEISSMSTEYQKTISKQKEYKDLLKTLEELKETQASITTIVTNQNTKAEKLNEVYTASQIALIKSREVSQEILDIHSETGDKLKEQTAEYQFQANIRKKTVEAEIEALKTQQKETDKLIKESRKSASDAISSSVHSLQTSLSNLKNVFEISKIADTVERSSRTIVQEELQIGLQANKFEFNAMKRGINDSYDVTLYTQKEVMSTYESLRSLGINSSEEAVDNFNAILQGQSLLGMSAETQAELVSLGNRYNKDMLTFMTTRTAEYMLTATNVGKQQLNELISMNASIATSLVNSGFSGENVLENLNNATVALTELNEGNTVYANQYQSALSSVGGMGIESTSALFGMDLQQIRDYMDVEGNNLFTLINSAQSTQMAALKNAIDSGDENTIGILSSTFGISSDFVGLMRYMNELQQKGIDIQQEILKQGEGSDEDALKNIENARDDSLSFIQEGFNTFGSWLTEVSDWATMDSVENSLSVIITLLTAIEATLAIQTLGKVFSGGKNILGKLTAKGGLSAAAKTLAPVGTVLSAATMGIDALIGYNNTASAMYGTDATTGEKWGAAGISALSGSGIKNNSDGSVDVAGTAWSGAGSGALKGAGLGMWAGAPGMAIGAAIGAVAGGLAGLYKGSKAEEEQLKIQQEQLELEEQIAKNTEAMASTSVTPTWAQRQVVSYRPGYETVIEDSGLTGGGAGGSIAPTATYAGGGDSFTGAQGEYYGPWKVSSDWGPRQWYRYDPEHPDRITDEDSKYYNHYLYKDTHYGIDLTKGGSQAIYASQGGTAKVVDSGSSGYGRHVRITNGNMEYIYGHLSSYQPSINGKEIPAGTLLGYMGNTGNSDGQHLHYEVRQGGTKIRPEPYLTDLIYSGDSSLIGSTSYAPNYDATQTSTNSELPYDGNSVLSTRVVKLTNIGGGDPVVKGLSTINGTLISLSNKQTEQEAILNMLSNKGKQNPIMS